MRGGFMRSMTPFRSNRSLMNWESPFEDLFNEFERSLSPNGSRDFNPALDVEEKEGVYLITIDLPGIKKEDIQINVNDRTLSVSGERSRETKGQGHYFERSYGRFARSLTLPENVNADAIEAHYEDGVLKVALPKAEEKKGKSIKIQSGKQNGGLLDRFFGNKDEKTVTPAPEKH
jgi:HSP20 family protein